MPNYILNRTHTHRSTLGVVSFIKGEPAWVIPAMEREVVAIGAIREDGQEVELLDAETPLKHVPQGLERTDELYAAFELIIQRNDAKDFTGSGTPTVKAVEKIVDFDVERTEVAEAWAEYQVVKAEAA